MASLHCYMLDPLGGCRVYCTNCGEQIAEKAEICLKCGVRPFRTKLYCNECGSKVKNEHQEYCVDCGVSLKKNMISSGSSSTLEPWIAGLLSFLLTGLGQMLIGQVKKGIVILIVSFFLGFVTFGLSAFIVIPLAIIDAYLIAKKVKEGKRVGEWEFF